MYISYVKVKGHLCVQYNYILQIFKISIQNGKRHLRVQLYSKSQYRMIKDDHTVFISFLWLAPSLYMWMWVCVCTNMRIWAKLSCLLGSAKNFHPFPLVFLPRIQGQKIQGKNPKIVFFNFFFTCISILDQACRYGRRRIRSSNRSSASWFIGPHIYHLDMLQRFGSVSWFYL